MLLKLMFFSFLLCSCSAEMEVEMKTFAHFKYAHMQCEIGSVPSHIIYLQGFEYGRDDDDLQLLALYYYAKIDTTELIPEVLKFVNKKVFSGDQVNDDSEIAFIYIDCLNNQAHISSTSFFKDGKREQRYKPATISDKVAVRCKITPRKLLNKYYNQ